MWSREAHASAESGRQTRPAFLTAVVEPVPTEPGSLDATVLPLALEALSVPSRRSPAAGPTSWRRRRRSLLVPSSAHRSSCAEATHQLLELPSEQSSSPGPPTCALSTPCARHSLRPASASAQDERIVAGTDPLIAGARGKLEQFAARQDGRPACRPTHARSRRPASQRRGRSVV